MSAPKTPARISRLDGIRYAPCSKTAILIAVFIVGGRAVITMAGAITMPRSWSLRRSIITTIDLFWLSDESKNPVLLAGFFCFWLRWNKLPL